MTEAIEKKIEDVLDKVGSVTYINSELLEDQPNFHTEVMELLKQQLKELVELVEEQRLRSAWQTYKLFEDKLFNSITSEFININGLNTEKAYELALEEKINITWPIFIEFYAQYVDKELKQ